MQCRHCQAPLEQGFLDLGSAPLSNAYLTREGLSQVEAYYPLRLRVCQACWLVQTEDYADSRAIFDADYAYHSSVSRSWLDHAAEYAAMITRRLSLDASSMVVEVASNDGYLLRNFLAAGIPCLGVEPTHSTAQVAREQGIPVSEEFFTLESARRLAGEGFTADLIVGNNVYAHVPDINDFTAGLAALLKPEGVVTLEFPHLQQLVAHCQFDTVYHEHFSYLSLTSVESIFRAAGLRIFDVERLPTHGGSLRVYGCLTGSSRPTTPAVAEVNGGEQDFGLMDPTTYQAFQGRADQVKNALLSFLLSARQRGDIVHAYGAAAKGNTLLNYAGVKPDLLPAVYDAAESKQGKFLPGSHIPIRSPDEITRDRPDYMLVLPWNIVDEITAQLDAVRTWGCRFLVAVPELRVF